MPNPKIQEMLDLAAQDVRRLHSAATCAASREAWIAFLEHANRAINRIEGHARRTGQESKYKDLLKEIWATPLAAYMRTARNTHEHGVIDIDVDDLHYSRLVEPSGVVLGAPVMYAKNPAGEDVVIPQSFPTEVWSSQGRPPEVVSVRPSVRMAPVLDRQGMTLFPPSVRALLSADEPDVAAAARAYLDWVISKVNTFQ